MESTEAQFRYAESHPDDGLRNLSGDPTSKILAACIANQQRAGFGSYLDLRQAECEHCKAPGFNTGWGFWQFACGAEVMTDGTECEPCPAVESAAP